MATIHLIRLPNWPILEQLRLEEALLRVDTRNWCVINEGSPPAIVMGISGKPHQLIDRTRFTQQPLSLIKRFSGGGTVVIDENTCFITWICSSTDTEVPCYPKPVLQWSEMLLAPIFAELPFSLRENDYTLKEKKFGGNALYMRKGRWLLHSSLIWDYHPERMEYLLLPPKMPSYREQRGHDAFLCRLSDHLSTRSIFWERFNKALRKGFDVKEIPVSSVIPLLETAHRRGTTLVDKW